MNETKVFKAEIAAYPEASQFVEGLMDENMVSMKVSMQIMIAFEELFVNVAHYAYKEAIAAKEIECGTAEVSVSIEDRKVSITIKDSGTAFNPLLLPEPDTTLSADERKIGGLGIHMVRKSMDNFTYSRTDGFNIVTIVKGW